MTTTPPKTQSSDKLRVSLKSIARNINDDWLLDDWLQWPPDAFALFSIIINRTGIYKYLLLDTDWWQKDGWSAEIDSHSDNWIHAAGNLLLNKDKINFPQKGLLQFYYNILQQEWDKPSIEIDHLRVLGNIYDKSRDGHRQFIQAILYFAAVADVTCGGLGFLGQSLGPQKISDRIFMGVANLLLNNTGTLSTISKQHGTVLPKMRTPQGGMTVRSMTHHLTFHSTEAEVIWRTFPLLQKRDKDLNILAVPFPYKIEDDDFIPRPEEVSQVVRYFEPKIKEKLIDYGFIRSLVDWVGASAEDGQEIDIIVLPEMALTYYEYTYLLKAFETEFLEKKRCKCLPVIVSGITKEKKVKYGIVSIDEPYQNEARIAIFFAGQWYTTTQRKHHRWQLNRSQVEQYELEKTFTGNKLWFEYCSASQRRMTVMAPNGDLALTALICEDLAQQEPVSEIIRGIGPSLLLALLSDGPQLTSRWSARYAGVLASDPGTAVLSLTSLGMTIRSKKSDDKNALPIFQPGLWKDLDNNYVELVDKTKRDAFFFKVASTPREEFTFDARSDRKSSSYLHWAEKDKPAKGIDFPKIDGTPPVGNNSDGPDLKNEFESLRELSALQFAVDSMIEILMDLNMNPNVFEDAVKLFLDLLTGAKRFNSSARKFRGQIFLNMNRAWTNPGLLGIAATAAENYADSMNRAAEEMRMIIKHVKEQQIQSVFELYKEITRACEGDLKAEDGRVGDKRTSMSILYNLSNRLTAKDQQDRPMLLQFNVTASQMAELQREIDIVIEMALFKA